MQTTMIEYLLKVKRHHLPLVECFCDRQGIFFLLDDVGPWFLDLPEYGEYETLVFESQDDMWAVKELCGRVDIAILPHEENELRN